MAHKPLPRPRGLRLDPAIYRDKVLGCWHGKNIGGTLGGPLEEKFGREEMFAVDWYPDLPPGGIPNDDLELQLIWLQALQDRGPGLRARDLADYWLDCVRYNFDEYGLAKANLQRGLAPPVSGWHNNWFRDCMGSPIRSELWACLAPGTPEIAAHYAFEDAICDHGGGESVLGEVFNAVVESCAFCESDRVRLVEIGLGAIPSESLTHRAVARALACYRAGMDWVEARQRIKREFYLPLAQYSPINLGFQTIGLLYGADFADAICKAVNCGWDTDCTGATVGAMLGIILGAEQLPARWREPLRDEISTNLPNGGIRHLRAPTDVKVLTDQVTALAPRVLRYWNADTVVEGGGAAAPVPAPDFALDPDWLRAYDPAAVTTECGTLTATIRYAEHAAAFAGRENPLEVRVSNSGPEPLDLHLQLRLPAGWQQAGPPAAFRLEPGAELARRYRLTMAAAALYDTNEVRVDIAAERRPALPSLPAIFLGGFRWLHSPPVPGTLRTPSDFDASSRLTRIPEGWSERWLPGNDLEPEALFQGAPGTIYLAHFIHSDVAQEVILGVSNTQRMQLWLNGRLEHETGSITGLRPNQGNGGGDGSNYKECCLQPGFNHVLIRLERGGQPLQAHFTLGRPDRVHRKCLGHAVLGLRRSVLPWEAAS
jgi:ADP-ribosylglycohydrolase